MSTSEIPAQTKDVPIEDLRISDHEHWKEGPPLDQFKRMRSQCPVHWSSGMSEYPEEGGFWSVTNQELVHAVSRDWQTYSSEVDGFLGLPKRHIPLDVQQGMFIGMDPPKHDRLKGLFNRGFTPKRIAEHEGRIRDITCAKLDLLEGSESCDLVKDVAQPIVSRVIGDFMGIDEEDDAVWADLMNALVSADDPVQNPEGPQTAMERDIPEIVQRCQKLIEARKANPTDDLTTILVEAEVDGETLTEWEIVMGFILLMTAGNDSTKATYCSGMLALMQDPEQKQMLVDDPSLIPDAVEEALRMFPAFAHFRRTATCDTELGDQKIKKGDKVVMWYPSTGRDESVYEDPDRFDVTRKPEHQAFGAGGRHFCLGTALARLELKVMMEETLKRWPNIEIAGPHRYAEAIFINQLTTLPVRLNT